MRAGGIEAFLPKRKIKTGTTSPKIGEPQTVIEVEIGARADDISIINGGGDRYRSSAPRISVAQEIADLLYDVDAESKFIVKHYVVARPTCSFETGVTLQIEIHLVGVCDILVNYEAAIYISCSVLDIWPSSLEES